MAQVNMTLDEYCTNCEVVANTISHYHHEYAKTIVNNPSGKMLLKREFIVARLRKLMDLGLSLLRLELPDGMSLNARDQLNQATTDLAPLLADEDLNNANFSS